MRSPPNSLVQGSSRRKRRTAQTFLNELPMGWRTLATMGQKYVQHHRADPTSRIE